MSDLSDRVTIYICQGDTDANLTRTFLESRGIEVFFLGESLRTTHALTMDGLGKVELQVPRESEAEARDLLQRMEAGEFDLEEGDG